MKVKNHTTFDCDRIDKQQQRSKKNAREIIRSIEKKEEKKTKKIQRLLLPPLLFGCQICFRFAFSICHETS